MAISKLSESRFSNGLKKYNTFYDGITGQEIRSGLVLKLDAGDQSSYGGQNFFTYSQDYSNVAWAKNSTSVTTNAIIAPDGTLTADKVIGINGASARQSINQTVSVTSGTTYSFSTYLKAGERRYATMWFDSPNVTQGAYLGAGSIFDLQSGSFLSGSESGVSAESVGNGWWKLTVTGTPNNGVTSMIFNLSVGSPNNDTAPTIATGDGVSGIYVWGGHVRLSSSPNVYVRTTSSAASSLTGSWYDMSDSGAHATFQNSPTWSSSNGGYFSFNGSNQRATSSISVVTANTPRTACVWFSGTANDRIPLSLGNTSTANEAFSIVPQTGNTVNSYGLTGPYDETGLTTGGVNLLDGNWHYVCLSYDSNYSGTLRLYVDGNFASSLIRTAGKSYATSSGYQIGNWGNNDRYWSGNIAQASVYNRILSTAEVRSNFNYYRRRFNV